MSDGESIRPRRAFDPTSNDHDDTSMHQTPRPRRGQETQVTPMSAASESEPTMRMSHSDSSSSLAEPGRPAESASYARRSAGSAFIPDTSSAPAPPSKPARASDDVSEETIPVRPGRHADYPTIPRHRLALPPTAPEPDRPRRTKDKTRQKEHDHGEPADASKNRGRLILVAVSAFLALVIIIGILWSMFSSSTTPGSPTASPTREPLVTEADLWTPEDLGSAIEGTSWQITQTLSELPNSPTRVACQSAVKLSADPLLTRQRLLATANNDHAGLHQVDEYDSAEAATAVYNERAKALAICDEVPTYIAESSSVSGIGDAAVQTTIVYQDEKALPHVVLIVRTGALVSMFDITYNGEKVSAEQLARAAALALGRSCSRFGTCPANVSVTAGIPPVTEPSGWLTVSDFPRITPGSGKWTATDPQPLKVVSTNCENLSLGSIQGPTERQQRTFLLTDDPNGPAGFGADESILVFPDAEAAVGFAKTLSDNIATCAKRQPTATVSEPTPLETAVGDVKVSGQAYIVTQTPAEGQTMTFQTAVMVSGKYVIYLTINTPTPSFKLADDQFHALALRAGLRTSQRSS